MRRRAGSTVGGTSRPAESSDRCQSEVVGVVLLTAIVVILVSTAGFFLLTQFTDEDEQPRVNVGSEVTNGTGGNGTIVLNHQGGDDLDPQAIRVVLQGSDAGEFVLGQNFTERSGNNVSFSRGDSWELADGTLEAPLAGRFTLLVVHEPSGTALHREPYDV
jgi:flagellin-like protein